MQLLRDKAELNEAQAELAKLKASVLLTLVDVYFLGFGEPNLSFSNL